MENILPIIAAIAFLVVGLISLRYAWAWMVSNQRLAAGATAIDQRDDEALPSQRSWLGWWLFQAGFRKNNAVTMFVFATVVSTLLAIVVAFGIYQSQVITLLETILRAIPGNVGEVFLPLVWISPLASIAVLAALPAVIVRGRRRKRVTQIEQDLPLTLDLLATLAEAGLSFDAALDRVLETQRRERPLAEDFRLFRLEILTGRGRVDALQRLNRHVNVPWFGIFVSALIHAEQVGAGLAATLRAQADDLRGRRRERALAMAMAVPVKLLFPLITCFLPGIMIASLGPIIFQIVQVLDQFTRSAFGG
jgi:pilus assembly protein TadC